MPMKRPGFWVPTLRLGASKKKTSSSTIGATSRKTFISPSTRQGNSAAGVPGTPGARLEIDFGGIRGSFSPRGRCINTAP